MVRPLSPPPGGRLRPQPFPLRLARVARRFFLGCLSLVLLSIGSYCAWSLNRFVYQSDYFTVRDIQIRGASDELKQEARAWLQKHIKTNGNLCELDKHFLGRQLSTDLSRAKAAQVTKVYPGTLRIEFTERSPVIIAQLDDPFLMDEEGVLLARIPPQTIHRLHLPILTGIHDTACRPGDHIKQERLADVLATVCYIQEKETLLDKMIVEWNINGRAEVTAILNTHTEVRFGERPPLELLDKLITGLEMNKELENASYIDLRMERQLVYK